jgi:hypothetical protein
MPDPDGLKAFLRAKKLVTAHNKKQTPDKDSSKDIFVHRRYGENIIGIEISLPNTEEARAILTKVLQDFAELQIILLHQDAWCHEFFGKSEPKKLQPT